MIADTHVPSRAQRVPDGVFEVFRGVDLILHAGDISIRAPLDELGRVAPVLAVHGNIDDLENQTTLPPQVRVTLGDVTIGMLHNSGAAKGRRERMRRMFPGCRVVVFGHSHIPLCEDAGGLLLLNPGSAGDPRRLKIPTVALLEITGGQPTARIVQVPPTAPG